MNIIIVAVGKIKEKYLKMGIDEYAKRLKRYCNINIIEVADEKAPENISLKEMEIIKKTEGEKILRHFRRGIYKIALCIDGTEMSTAKMSSMIREFGINGTSNIMFVIGGSLGLWSGVVKECDFKLSFSKLTFPHQLMRLIFLEQIYRCFKIINNEPYHK
ncbi:MAG: 23S rRNA (pseudouridine(1915)-N(3))-methyltransferase RlmH [Clostridiales bacterium]|nr:23S rRNA (pseudouridine(1915)-N(3))-methyltransferase RlmH [Clostridiales bacterium]HBM80554.1 23S rRNA (pseudouridine(1915)-N(3))-methyltransferase RlmH [Clostridiaceae bacterium]